MNRNSIITAAALTLVAAGLLLAGPLNPPAGPVTSTYKTLTEVEPRIAINATNTPGDADATPSTFKITSPGSYYLTSNLVVGIGRNGIEITGSGVTIDLNGFQISGFGSLSAIMTSSTAIERIAIRNGQIVLCGSGIILSGIPGVAVENVNVEGCLSGDGIAVGNNSRVSNCIAKSNQGTGIAVGSGSIVGGCVASINGIGIAAGAGSTVTACTAFGNTGNGISTGDGSTVTGCTARSNTGNGIAAGLGSTVAGCTARLNNGNGIVAGNGSTVAGCTAASNTGNGIQVDGDCRVTDNTCESNGFGTGTGAGIYATGGDNRIEGNNCVDADRGIDVDGNGNIIIKNTCSGNTLNWDIATDNYYGPIINRTGVATAAVNGSAAASTLATTDPHANFTY